MELYHLLIISGVVLVMVGLFDALRRWRKASREDEQIDLRARANIDRDIDDGVLGPARVISAEESANESAAPAIEPALQTEQKPHIEPQLEPVFSEDLPENTPDSQIEPEFIEQPVVNEPPVAKKPVQPEKKAAVAKPAIKKQVEKAVAEKKPSTVEAQSNSIFDADIPEVQHIPASLRKKSPVTKVVASEPESEPEMAKAALEPETKPQPESKPEIEQTTPPASEKVDVVEEQPQPKPLETKAAVKPKAKPTAEFSFETPQECKAARETPKAEEKPAADVTDYQVLMVHLEGREGMIDGATLQMALEREQLYFGEMDIFHRHLDKARDGEIQFSLVNSVEPGNFDLDTMAQLTTPSVTMFVQIPGPANPRKAVWDMLETADSLARQINANLLDGKRCLMKQDQAARMLDQAERSTPASV